MSAGYYRSVADVSPATATKDLGAATSAGLLRAVGQRRGRRYLPTDRLYEVVGGAFSIQVGGPPDVARAGIVSELSRRLTESGDAFGPGDEVSFTVEDGGVVIQPVRDRPKLRGAFRGSGLLEGLEADHRDEVSRGR